MPSCRRKHVLPTEPSAELLDTTNHDAHREVYLLTQTGEIFETYEAYAARMSFYKTKQFQCDVTGKSGLDYFQALESEQHEARTLHSRFPEPLKAAVLRSVQWRVIGRLDHLVEEVHERFQDRFFEGENIFVEVEGHRYAARVEKVRFKPSVRRTMLKRLKMSNGSSNGSLDGSSDELSDSDESLCENNTGLPLHITGGDMTYSLPESLRLDNPKDYIYTVEILEEEPSDDEQQASSPSIPRRESDRVKERKENGLLSPVENFDGDVPNLAGKQVDLGIADMTRDRLVFSKSLLRRFLRECLDRESSLASPWTVKPVIARRYGLPLEMPESIKVEVERTRKDEIDKRKKVWEEKEAQAEREGRLTKKMIREREREAKAAAKAAEAVVRQQEADEKAALSAKNKAEKRAADKMAKELADRLAEEEKTKKKRAIRYPTEDLDVQINDKDKKAGMQLKKPAPSRSPDKLPFVETKGTFEKFITVWNFLICFGSPLHISFFTLDEFEHALRHTASDLPCTLLAEIHSVLVYHLRSVPFTRHSAVLSLLDLKRTQMDIDQPTEPSIDMLTEALADVGNNWERVPLKSGEGRIGWQDAMIGCIKDHGTIDTFPRLQSILQRLMFDVPEGSDSQDKFSQPDSSPLSSPTQPSAPTLASPAERYYALSPEDRLAILKFLCDTAVNSKSLHSHLEACEEQLTALRKSRIEVNREKKQHLEAMSALLAEKKDDEDKKDPEDVAASVEASDVESDIAMGSEDNSEAGSSVGRRSNSTQRQQALRIKAQQSQMLAKQREVERQKLADKKQALAEHRRLDEEVAKLDRKLEGIERDFRKIQGSIRLKPLGKDRFHNRIWWFDGCGTSSLIGSGGAVQFATGRLFIQGPSSLDKDLMDRKDDVDIAARRLEEEGEDGMLGVDEWAVYSDLEEMDEFVAWLNPKGVRELALKNALTKWWDVLAPGVRRRMGELASNIKQQPETARRSARAKSAVTDLTREPYMQWTNRKAINLP